MVLNYILEIPTGIWVKAKSPNEIQIGDNLGETFDNTNAQYGLIQSLKGFLLILQMK